MFVKMSRLILFTCVSFYYVTAQYDDARVRDLVNSIFTTEGPTPSPMEVQRNNSLLSKADCECVPYYLCDNGTKLEEGYGIIDIRVENTCHDRLQVCCGTGNTVTKPITPKSNPHPQGTCGIRNDKGFGFRITGDTDETQFGEFPWMVALLKKAKQVDKEIKYEYHCGASLIHPQAVLTAAHCVSDKSEQFIIRAGEWDTQTTYELLPHQDRDVKSIIVHPKFYSGALLYDFALLILELPVEITDNVDIVCLPNKNEVVDNVWCYATGWGKGAFEMEESYQAILRKVSLSIVNSGTCQEQLRTTRLGSRFKLHETFICAGGEKNKDVCKGDGGSPLVCPIPGHENKYYQVGIVSWGIGCGEKGIPGVYAHIGNVREWIDNIMNSEKLTTGFYQY